MATMPKVTKVGNLFDSITFTICTQNVKVESLIEEIDKLIEFAFNEGYNQCMLNEVKEIKNERKIDK